jgi:hypothetical protein
LLLAPGLDVDLKGECRCTAAARKYAAVSGPERRAAEAIGFAHGRQVGLTDDEMRARFTDAEWDEITAPAWYEGEPGLASA